MHQTEGMEEPKFEAKGKGVDTKRPQPLVVYCVASTGSTICRHGIDRIRILCIERTESLISVFSGE